MWYLVKHIDGRCSIQTKPGGVGLLIATDLDEKSATQIVEAHNRSHEPIPAALTFAHPGCFEDDEDDKKSG